MEFEGFIDIHNNENTENTRRISVFLNSFEGTSDKKLPLVDLLLLTKSLKDIGSISRDLSEKLFDLSTSEAVSKHEQLFTFLQHVMQEVTIDKVYAAFCNSNCNVLFPLYIIHKQRYNLRGIGKVTVPFNRYANERYRFIKMCVDNNCFNGEAKQKLCDLRDKVVERMAESRIQDERQKRLEEKVIIDLHTVQLHGVNDFQRRLEILQSMKETCTQNLDRTSLELTYHSKVAVTYAKSGHPAEAEEHIRQTLIMCDRCEPCFATIMALNDVMYAYQELCFVNRSRQLLERSKNHGQLMYHVLCCNDEDVINQWKRIVLLFVVMTCLHISHEFETGDVNDLSTEEVNQARILISEVMKVSKGIETRREMVLYLCQGRLHELTDTRIAIAYVKKAYDLSNDGCLRNTEKANIQQYLAALRGSL